MKSKMLAVCLTASLVALGGAALLGFRESSKTPSVQGRRQIVRESGSSATEQNHLALLVNRLRLEVAELKAWRDGSPSVREGDGGEEKLVGEVSDPPASEFSREELRAREDEKAAQAKAFLETAWREEEPDRAWAEQATQQMDVALSNEILSDVTTSTVCKASLCRVEFESNDEVNAGTVPQRLALKFPWSAPGYFSLDMETGKGVYYLARENSALPRPAEDNLRVE